MSFIAEFQPLFSLASEEHGTGEPLPVFSFRPTGACRRELANRQMVARQSAGSARVFYQRNPLAPDPLLGRITARTRFTFALILSQSDFFSLYEPDLTADTGPQLYLDNLTPAGAIQASVTLSDGARVQPIDAARVYPAVFQAAADVSGGGAPTMFRVRDKFDGSLVVQVPITPVAGSPTALTRIDLSNQPRGVYTLETDAAGSPVKSIYVDDELAGSQIAGVVDVYWETPQDTAPPDGVAYVVRFARRP